ncbi:type IV toxin-antitoxin system AbiEi family antitoxin domain-containing protein [Nocardia asteroides]|uniref:type IV toxin-antitoxin system AbiEi family antitoxin domain-containing protein n=1 Tax=Nocardia asteroides TaxID=1824 RepID=UPI001E6529EB|nr:type IV toxin-antitoxin system AbiEi family antitoxin domain-containing protein [Nocardia asteroides]UGT58884.1 type IV toxin-antitoxin system AbiEi family antitoxin domain-containing protein [Nocardia asteroides]
MLNGPLLELASLGEEQWGLFTTRQAALERGVTPLQLKRLTDHGHLIRIQHGVYRVAGAPDSPLDAIRSAWLALEPARTAGDRLGDPVPFGVVSHRSAAVLQQLGDLDADIHQFTVDKPRRSRSSEVSFTVAALSQAEWHRVDGLPVTRPLRTVADLAAANTDGGHLASVVRDTILSGGTTSAELAEALRPYAHNYGAHPGDGAEVVRTFIHTAGVPASAVELAHADGGRDIQFPPEVIAVIRKSVREVLSSSGFDEVLRDAVAASLPSELISQHLAAMVEPIASAIRPALSPVTSDEVFTLNEVQAALQSLRDAAISRTQDREPH